MESFVMPALLIGLLLSSCGGLTPPASNAVPSDCGVFAADGASCFEDALHSCTQSSILLFENVPPVSAKIDGTAGGSGCTVTITAINRGTIDRIMLSNSASQFEVDQLNAKIDASPDFQALEGKTATCVVDKLKAQEFAVSYPYQCTGPLADAIKNSDMMKRFS